MTVRRWFPFAAAAIVLGVAACASIAANQGGGASPTASSSPVVETTAPPAAPTSAVAAPTALSRTLGPGLTGEDVTGKVTPDLWTKIEQALTIRPLRPDATPTHLEVYLPSQTAVLFQDGKARLITHISSGTGKEWCEEG